MEIAHARDAVLSRKFHFRRIILPAPTPREGVHTAEVAPGSNNSSPETTITDPVESEYRLMTINEILSGNTSTSTPFVDLIPLVKQYFGEAKFSIEAKA